MATVTSLRSELAHIRRAAGVTAPRTWSMVLEVDEPIPAAIAAKIRPDDQVYIRRWPKGFLSKGVLSEGNCSYGCVHWHGGAAIIRLDGSLEKVRKH